MSHARTSNKALLVLSFGGPNKADDIIPFLENVTRGRGIPRERLAEVGEHYYKLGGKSPINEQNLSLIANIASELSKRNLTLPIYFGNRNWEPYVEDVLQSITRDGITEVYVFVTSAWGGYSGCAQYNEDIQRALQSVKDSGLHPPKTIRLPHFHNHPAFIAEFAHAVDEARQELPRELQETADLVFTAHSVPTAADAKAGPGSFGGNLYSQQVLDSSRLVQEASSFAGCPGTAADISWTGKLARNENVGGRGVGPANTGDTIGIDVGSDTAHTVELVWQSRSGSPHTPWLEPDICDHIAARAKAGNKRPIVLCPIGFVTDHVEVMWDLDTEAKDTAKEHGIPLVRVATPGLSTAFASMVVDLAAERGAFGNTVRVTNQYESQEPLGMRGSCRTHKVYPGPKHTAASSNQDTACAIIKNFSTVPNFGCTTNGESCEPGCCS